MNKEIIKLYIGSVMNDDQTVSLVELCHCCSVPVEYLLTMTEYGIIEPINTSISHIRWRFTVSSISRVQTAIRLQRDLDVNMAGAALAIELLDEIKQLRQSIASH